MNISSINSDTLTTNYKSTNHNEYILYWNLYNRFIFPYLSEVEKKNANKKWLNVFNNYKITGDSNNINILVKDYEDQITYYLRSKVNFR